MLGGLALVLIVTTMSAAAPSIAPNAATAYSLWGDAQPANLQTGAVGAQELGTQFSTDQRGYVVALRFYKNSADTGRHVGKLWTSDGRLLASASYTVES
ncbi:MAG TPA: DUF4082 domain-containing protein, partial [Lapillicoccus sp.]|nr:DUF4082 domain-containing protein [Lapillicoccus sp.]